MGQSAHSVVFGKRKEPHTVIIARGDQVRHFTVKPWLAATLITAASTVVIGYLAATSYLVFRDDLIGASVARQARLQQDYEDRISALRTQVDRVTSRQMLDQQLVENKVAKLLEQQSLLSERHSRLEPLLPREQIGQTALPSQDAPTPSAKPETVSLAQPAQAGASSVASLASLRLGTADSLTAADRADIAFVAINQSLRDIETNQMAKLDTLTNDAFRTADGIATVLADAGLELDTKGGEGGMGGPFIPLTGADPFDAKVKELDAALDKLDAAKATARRLPLGLPAPGQPVTSTFGVRTDPILGTPAMHSGIDFRAPVGMAARATAPGTVIKAGWNGGYGQMVEIAHGGGFSTRYAHLSRIDVTEGEKVAAGAIVGESGSTGRSTGPHLHYEVRENGEAVDPIRFLQAGKKIRQFLGNG